MRILNFKLFESNYDSLMGKLLHVYGSIPTPKEKSSVVIGNIIKYSENDILDKRGKVIKTKHIGEYYKLGDNIDMELYRPQDKLRFRDYFDSLINSKDTRGHNFEGLICGLFGGELSIRGSKHDVVIDGKNYSIKFTDNKSKAPELGSYTSKFDEDFQKEISEKGGLGNIFKGDDEDLKKYIWSVISSGVDGWIFAYPDDEKIVLNIVTKRGMGILLKNGLVVASKNGWKVKMSLALSATYRHYQLVKESIITLPPKLDEDDLKLMYRNSDEEIAAEHLFGSDFKDKIRPDLLRYILNNKKHFIKKMKDLN